MTIATTLSSARRVLLVATLGVVMLVAAVGRADAAPSHPRIRMDHARHPRLAMPDTRHRTGRQVRDAAPMARFNTGSRPATMAQYLLDVTNIVRGFWRGAGVGTEVNINWTTATGIDACGNPIRYNNPHYCWTSSTIYVSEQYAVDLWNGVAGTPGTGRAYGDFAVAFLIAHEYAHNVQYTLRNTLIFNGRVMPVELEADCLAGVWANNAYYSGRMEAGDYQEGLATTLAYGDFGYDRGDHHGTPVEREGAFAQGYNSGNGRACTRTFLGF